MEGERTLIGWTPSNKLLVPSRRNLAAARKRPHYVAVLPLPPSPPQLFVNSWWTLCTDQWLSGSNRHRVRCRRIHRFNLMIGYRPDVVPIKSKRVRAGKLSAGRPVWQQKRRPASAAVNDADGWEGWGGGVRSFLLLFSVAFFPAIVEVEQKSYGQGVSGVPSCKNSGAGRASDRRSTGRGPPSLAEPRWQETAGGDEHPVARRIDLIQRQTAATIRISRWELAAVVQPRPYAVHHRKIQWKPWKIQVIQLENGSSKNYWNSYLVWIT